MSVIKTADLRNLESGFSARFQDAYDNTDPVADMISVTQEGSNSSFTFGFLASIGVPRAFTGEKEFLNLETHSLTVESTECEKTVQIPKKALETDQLGMVAGYAQLLGESAARWKEYMVADLLTDISGSGEGTLSRDAGLSTFGGYGLGFDGLPLFSTAHPLDPAGNQSNNFTGRELTTANVEYVCEQMRGYRDEMGAPLGVRPTHLIVPAALENEALRAVSAGLIVSPDGTAAAVENVMKGRLEVVVLPWLDRVSTTAWYVADMSKPSSAGVVVYQRKAPEFMSLMEGSDHAFKRMSYVIGFEASGAPAPGLWWLIARADQ